MVSLRTRVFLAVVASFSLAMPSRVLGETLPEATYTLREPGLPAKTPLLDKTQRRPTPTAIPDIYGPGAVLRAGNLHMKVSNNGIVGNPFLNISSDPSGQWPGSSGVEYLRALVLAVGAVNPQATDPKARRRVSSGVEWRPATTADIIFATSEKATNGRYLTNDDQDFEPITGLPMADEEFLDGKDDDGDRLIDEDFAGFGDLMYSWVMRDDTPDAINTVTLERHVPLGLECRQTAWSYSIPGYSDFNVIEYTIVNRSGHELDSVYVSFPVDLDAGSFNYSAGFYVDDKDVPFFPNGVLRVPRAPRDGRICPTREVKINGFSVVDGDGDNGTTPGVVSFLLLGHTFDTFGVFAPESVGFGMFRSFVGGTAYVGGGAPATDQQRFELMRRREHINADGFIDFKSTGQLGDWAAWNAIGPFRYFANGARLTFTIAITVSPGSYLELLEYPTDYAIYRAGRMSLDELLRRHPALETALTAQLAYEGIYEAPRPGFHHLVSDCLGCETGVKLPRGTPAYWIAERSASCKLEPPTKLVTDRAYTWFDNDCDVCTGVRGLYQRRWEAKLPPPSPNLNVSARHNYSDNPDRVIASGDNTITIGWDNFSEITPDPRDNFFDFRTYRVWRVAEWQRPVGAAGPTEDDWEMLAELRLFDYADSNFTRDPSSDTLQCPKVFVQNYLFPAEHERCAPENATRYPRRVMLSQGGCRDSATVGICLRKGDLWDRQSGMVVAADTSVDCVRDSLGACVQARGRKLQSIIEQLKTLYRVGRYRMVDREVRNGFQYFYSVTAGDSTGDGELFGRRSTVEADAVEPQIGTRPSGGVWVVPNPYRGYRNLGERPSSWDQHPSPTDPSGTHIDFMGLPAGRWRIRIYTLAGDLVAELHPEDAVNESMRKPVTGDDGTQRPGYTRQQDHPGDGQARWNLISRNGQDVMSGIYLFTVDSDLGLQRGKFVIVR